MLNLEEHLVQLLTGLKEQHGTLYAGPDSFALDPEVERIRKTALEYVTAECWKRVFQEVQRGDSTQAKS